MQAYEEAGKQLPFIMGQENMLAGRLLGLSTIYNKVLSAGSGKFQAGFIWREKNHCAQIRVYPAIRDLLFFKLAYLFNKEEEFGTKRFQFLKILIIKPFKSIIKCEKRTKQNSDYQKTSFVRFLYLRLDFCPSLFLLWNEQLIYVFPNYIL